MEMVIGWQKGFICVECTGWSESGEKAHKCPICKYPYHGPCFKKHLAKCYRKEMAWKAKKDPTQPDWSIWEHWQNHVGIYAVSCQARQEQRWRTARATALHFWKKLGFKDYEQMRLMMGAQSDKTVVQAWRSIDRAAWLQDQREKAGNK